MDGAGRRYYGSVSPDGRVISFTDWDTGDLALHDVTTGQNRRLTTNKKDWDAYAIGSAISRDGRHIAYGWALLARPCRRPSILPKYE